MAFTKLGEWTEPVVSLEDKPRLSAEQLKAAFDSNSNQIKEAFNAFIDEIKGQGASADIGTEAYKDIQETKLQNFLKALSDKIDNAEIEAGAVTSVFGRIGDVLAESGDYKALQISMADYQKGTSEDDVVAADNVSTAVGKIENKIGKIRNQVGTKQNKVMYGTSENATGGDTLFWDGDTTGLTSVGGMVYKVSDFVPSLDDLTGGCEIIAKVEAGGVVEAMTETLSGEEVLSHITDNVVNLSVILIVLEDGITIEDLGMTFDEKGIYFMKGTGPEFEETIYASALTINGFKDFSSSVSMWDGDTTGKETIIYGGSTLCKISEECPIIDDTRKGFGAFVSSGMTIEDLYDFSTATVIDTSATFGEGSYALQYVVDGNTITAICVIPQDTGNIKKGFYTSLSRQDLTTYICIDGYVGFSGTIFSDGDLYMQYEG